MLTTRRASFPIEVLPLVCVAASRAVQRYGDSSVDFPPLFVVFARFVRAASVHHSLGRDSGSDWTFATPPHVPTPFRPLPFRQRSLRNTIIVTKKAGF
ncbi:hypothetical protein [Paraburkholderia susongensis]|uniref:hypothetical protein n=1 Tax=Paraburkholderia susongensis TaxID=1515439 RepID=UPI00117F1440|nr:hypothetical protein [Paraburkholderia susongensis]